MPALTSPYVAKPYLLDRETAPAFWLVATLWMPMATGIQTGNGFALIEQWMPFGLGPTTHRHPWANEGFYILDGVIAYHAEGKTLRAGAGSYIHIPRCLPHSFTVESEEAHVLNFYAPAGFDLVIMSVASPAAERRRPTMKESAPPNPDEVRILSRLFGQEAVTAMPFCQPSTEPLMVTEPGTWTMTPLKLTDAAALTKQHAFGLDLHLLATAADTNGDYDLSEVIVPGDAGLPTRVLAQDEAVYVLEGSLNIAFGNERRTAGAGSFGYFPTGSCCSWSASREGARLLLFHLPGGFDSALVRSAGEKDRMEAYLEATGTRFDKHR